jgi:hypothetical protein
MLTCGPSEMRHDSLTQCSRRRRDAIRADLVHALRICCGQLAGPFQPPSIDAASLSQHNGSSRTTTARRRPRAPGPKTGLPGRPERHSSRAWPGKCTITTNARDWSRSTSLLGPRSRPNLHRDAPTACVVRKLDVIFMREGRLYSCPRALPGRANPCRVWVPSRGVAPAQKVAVATALTHLAWPTKITKAKIVVPGRGSASPSK